MSFPYLKSMKTKYKLMSCIHVTWKKFHEILMKIKRWFEAGILAEKALEGHMA